MAISMDELKKNIHGKTAEIYIARKGTVTVIRCGDDDYLINNVGGGGVIVNPVEGYWKSAIDWKGTRMEFMIYGVVPPKTPKDWSITKVFDGHFDMFGLYE